MTEQSEQDDAAMQTPPNGLAEECARFEKERMNRRAALRRFGIGAGATAFLALGVDDLARLVLGKMQEKHVMDGVTEQVARELHNAGVSFALPPPDPTPDDPKETDPCRICPGLQYWSHQVSVLK